ncbi:IclR family transcriptional regulator [Rhodococcus olei]
MTGHFESKPPTKVLSRITTLIDAFDGHGQLTLTEVAEHAGIPRSSAHRMLDSLVKLRWVRRDGHRYELGIRLAELGALAIHQARLHRVILPYLHDLHAQTGLLVHLAVLDGPDIVCLEKIGGRSAAAVPTRVGGRLPAHCSGLGKALLSCASPAELGALGSGPLPRRTAHSVVSRAQLDREITTIRQRGLAFDRQELTIGFGCVAAPVQVAAVATSAISLCGPIAEVQNPVFAGYVRESAQAARRALAYSIRRQSA